ncbi:unnamed protein product, partial [Staurois parvus]
MDQRLRTQYRRWTRDCGHSKGDGPETADTVQEMDQRLRTQYRRWTRDCGQYRRPETADIVQEMTRDCGHSTGDDQRLQTVQEMTRDCGQ